MSTSILIVKYAICYGAFLSVLLWSKYNGGNKLFDEKGPAHNTGALFASQIGGIIFLGIVPAFILDRDLSAMVFGRTVRDLFPVVVVILLFVAVILFARIQSENLFQKLVIDQKTFKIFRSDFVTRYVLLRLLYLFAYEIFLRGYLLKDSVSYLGITYAVVLNVVLYTLLHAPAGKKEMIACIPFGVLLCMVCIWLNAVWPAMLLHVALSMTYEINLVQKFSKPKNALI
ncbi:MAG TPA: CPBP family intramembrane glutamic endopeptidase [Chitinophagaceae bacterium]|jgi:membrane protease YdiL (CAAX protease family)|nr:CPBP family intramembrane glutamic endopeptidase [Chitinophagaceae bacterium]